MSINLLFMTAVKEMCPSMKTVEMRFFTKEACSSGNKLIRNTVSSNSIKYYRHKITNILCNRRPRHKLITNIMERISLLELTQKVYMKMIKVNGERLI